MFKLKQKYDELKKIIDKHKQGKLNMLIIAPIVTVFIIFLLLIAFYNRYQGKFYSDIQLSGMHLQDKSYEKVQALLEKKVIELNEGRIKLEYQDSSEKYSIEDFNVNWKIDSSLEKAKNYDELSIIEFVRSSMLGSESSIKFNLEKHFTNQIPEEILSDWDEKIAEDPVNASFHVDEQSQNIEIIPHQYGKKMNENKVRAEIEELISEISSDITVFTNKDTYTNIELSAETVSPKIEEQDLQKLNINTLVSSYHTEFSTDNQERTTNIKLAADKLDQYLINSEEQVSFNEVTGPRTKERGYKRAPILVQGEYVPGLGGGVCQVSSTLYNAAITAGMEIVQRSPHGRPVSYVPLGRDATVAYDYLDLIIKNDTDNALLLSTVVYNGSLGVDIYGSHQLAEQDYQLISDNYNEIPPETEYYWENNEGELRELSDSELDELLDSEGNLTDKYKEELHMEKVSEGRVGYEIDIYLLELQEGEELARELISQDTYASSPAEIVITE